MGVNRICGPILETRGLHGRQVEGVLPSRAFCEAYHRQRISFSSKKTQQKHGRFIIRRTKGLYTRLLSHTNYALAGSNASCVVDCA